VAVVACVNNLYKNNNKKFIEKLGMKYPFLHHQLQQHYQQHQHQQHQHQKRQHQKQHQ